MNAVINAMNAAFDVMFDTNVGIWTTSVVSGLLLVFVFAKLLGFGFRGVWAAVTYSASLVVLIAVVVIYCTNTHICLTEANNALSETKATLAKTRSSAAGLARSYASMINHRDTQVKNLNEELDKTKGEVKSLNEELGKTKGNLAETEEELSVVRKEKETLAERYDTLWKNVKSIENSVNSITSDQALNEAAGQASDFFADEEDIESLVSRTQHEIIREQLLNSL